MSETPDEPRPPGGDAGDQQDRWPHRRSDPPTPPPYDTSTQQASGDLPPFDDETGDGDGAEPAGRRRRLSGGRLAMAGVAAVLLLGGGVALAGGGGDDEDGGSDGVATVDGDGDQADADEPGGGEGGPVDESEMQDAMLEYASCMRDHGIDMPDPEFDGDGRGGGMVIQGGPDEQTGGRGPGSEDLEAAEEECGDIMDEVRPERAQLSPEEVAELQDKLLAMAECMREKGYDMPDPEVDADGRVRVQMRDGGPGSGPDGPRGSRDEEVQEAQEDCNEQAGLEGGPMGGPGGPGGDDEDGGGTT